MKRPVLNVGDVVRLSKRGKICRGMFLNHVMVVEKFAGDSSDGRTRIECSAFQDGVFIGKAAFKRRELWSTGYNSLAKTSADKLNHNDVLGASMASVSPKNTNDGRTHCMSCKQATKFVPGFGSSGYNICKNKSCSMYDR